MNDSQYTYSPTSSFVHKLEDVRTNDHTGYERIMKVINRLLANPDDADGKMHGVFNGRFKKYVGKSGYRVIYYWCEQCKKENKRMAEKCDNCDIIPDQSVIFFDLYHKKNSKRL